MLFFSGFYFHGYLYICKFSVILNFFNFLFRICFFFKYFFLLTFMIFLKNVSPLTFLAFNQVIELFYCLFFSYSGFFLFERTAFVLLYLSTTTGSLKMPTTKQQNNKTKTTDSSCFYKSQMKLKMAENGVRGLHRRLFRVLI